MIVKDYKGVKAVRAVAPVTDQQVEEALDNIRKENPIMAPVFRPAANGDTVILDFAGYCDGVQFEGGTAQDYELVLGSHRFVPGFEEQLVGMISGDSKDVNITFPQQYTPQLAGKDAVFKCTVKAVRKELERKLDDRFAMELFGMNTVDECRTYVRERLEEQAGSEADDQALESILDVICENNPWEPEDAAVDEELEKLIDAIALNMTGRRMKREEFYQLAGMSDKDFHDGLRPTAKRNLHVQEILNSIAQAEGITASDEDRAPRIEATAKNYGMTAEQFTKMMEPDIFDPEIIMQKTMKFLLDNAELTTVNE